MNVLVCITLSALVSGSELGSSTQFPVFLVSGPFSSSFLFILDNIVPMLHELGSLESFTLLLTLLFADFHPL